LGQSPRRGHESGSDSNREWVGEPVHFESLFPEKCNILRKTQAHGLDLVEHVVTIGTDWETEGLLQEEVKA
jgi:hypothetical protein